MSVEIEINDEKAERLVRELAELLGVDEETAVHIAVSERLERLRKAEPAKGTKLIDGLTLTDALSLRLVNAC